MTEPLSTEKRGVILDAARKRFAYYGFSKVTMDEIAVDAGMGKASLYYYFPTKERLFIEVVLQEKKQFLEQLKAIVTSDLDSADKLRNYVRKRIEYFRNLANLRALSFQQPKEMRESFHEMYKDFQAEELKLIQQLIQAGKREGEFAVSNPQRTAEIVLRVLQGIRSWLLNIHGKPILLDEDFYRGLEKDSLDALELLLHGIIRKK
ncbi:MAG: TetR/AcrR family transcriptional regulator [Candidatus Kryptoniota bacterium]